MKRTFMFFMIFCFSLLPLAAQQNTFSIKSFEQDPFDVTAQSKGSEKIDGSGDRYAIVKVESTNPEDDLSAYRFNFGFMKSLVEEHDHQLWVYVQKNAKHVSISRDGYLPIKKYDLMMTLQAGKTYIMQLSPSGYESKAFQQQMVLFDITPKDAQAVVMVSQDSGSEDLLGVQDVSGGVAKSLPFGTYAYKVRSEMYKTSEGRFVLNDRTTNHLEKVKLTPIYALITFNVDLGANIYVNGIKKGSKSWTGKLKPGYYKVECRQAQHHPSTQYFTIKENQKDTFELVPPTPIFGVLSVTSNPLGAEILIDDKVIGVTPMNINDVLIGNHELELRKEKYRRVHKDVEITENEVASVHVTLPAFQKSDDSTLWVDLGLSVKWASCNVGAERPEEYGDYFAWGEIYPKKRYIKENSLTYGNSFSGIDANDQYDAATKFWGTPARIPTYSEILELTENCTFDRIIYKGVKGYKITSKINGNSIFFPAAGFWFDNKLEYVGTMGTYWSSTSYNSSKDSYGLYISTDRFSPSWYSRNNGLTIRPVRD